MGLTRKLAPILNMTIKAEQIPIQNNLIQNNGFQSDLSKVWGSWSPGGGGWESLPGQEGEAAVPPSVLQIRLWVNVPLGMKGLS